MFQFLWSPLVDNMFLESEFLICNFPASSQRSWALWRCSLMDLFWHFHPRKLPTDLNKESHTWGFRWHLANSKVGTCALRGKNLIEGNRIVGAGVFGYRSDCLPVSPYMSRTICITYVVYFKIKHCSGPAVPNSVSKNLWVLPKQHHIVILTLSQTVLLQCQTLKIKCSLQFHFPSTNNWIWLIFKKRKLYCWH